MLYIQETHMEIGGIGIPGQVKKVEISGDANIDEIQDDKNKSLGYQATGYQPHKITVDIILERTSDMDFEDMVLTLHHLFKPIGQTEAKVLTIANSQTAAHNITQVYFKKIQTSKDTAKSYGSATLEFWEYIPLQVAVAATSRTNTASAGATSTTKTSSAAPETKPAAVSSEYQQYLNTQRGKAPKIQSKTSSSPAVDQ